VHGRRLPAHHDGREPARRLPQRRRCPHPGQALVEGHGRALRGRRGHRHGADFELGLLWPGLFDRYGDVFGIAFAVEGIFFFTEAIFIAIYIYGWKRLPPKAHFYTGIPIVLAGLGGALAVVAANSWMNQPGGFTTNAAGEVTSVDAWHVIFNRATPYEVPHMILAAYMVAGFLVASVYAAGMLRGHTDRYHRVGFAIPFVVASIATPIQLFVGDTAARAIADDQPAKFAAMEYVTKTGLNQTEWVGASSRAARAT
jgi:cytochrome bd ubiquinol oxidase subunit I